MRKKAQQLKQLAQQTSETLDMQNEQLQKLEGDMGETKIKVKQLNNKTKTALKNMSKKKALGGFLTVVGLFGILWILL